VFAQELRDEGAVGSKAYQINNPLALRGSPCQLCGMTWKHHLTDQEHARLDSIKAEHQTLRAEHRRIYDRCRKRVAASDRKNRND